MKAISDQGGPVTEANCTGCGRAREKRERWVWVYPPAEVGFSSGLLHAIEALQLRPDAQYCQACAAERGLPGMVH